MFVAELLLALPLLLTLHTFDDDEPDTERNHQLMRDTTRNRTALYITQPCKLLFRIANLLLDGLLPDEPDVLACAFQERAFLLDHRN